MTPHISIGSQVIIIGPSITGCNHSLGETFKISHECQGAYSGGGFPWYPASSLRLVDDGLKIGDWVEVIGSNTTDPSDDSELGDVFQISEIRDTPVGRKYSADGHYQYLASSLRKLAHEEITQHMRPKIVIPKPDWDEMVLRRVIDAEKRLSTIEKRLDAQKDAIIEMDLRLNVDAEAIKVLEGERPEVIDSETSRCPWNGIMVTIQRGKSIQKCPFRYADDARWWAYKVLDRMREA
jgi:hypothetical protein